MRLRPVGLVFTLVFAVALMTGCARGPLILSGFGDLYDGEGKYRGRAHGGIDVRGSAGTPVLAAADGRVLVAQETPGQGCGKYIVIDHAQDVIVRGMRLTPSTTYCHLSEHAVAEGSMVKRGQVIGYIGTTGWRRRAPGNTGFEHVHWELALHGSRVDPLPFTVGCFDPKATYPTDRLVLTYPVKC